MDMITLKIAICDDEVSTVEALSNFIYKTYRDMDMLIDKYFSGKDLLAGIEKQHKNYDLLLLDIEMEGIDGIQVAKKIQTFLPELYIVFVTSHKEFAMTGYEVSAYRFLAKPIQPHKLIEAITAVKREVLNQKTIQVEYKNMQAILKIKDILYIEAQDKQVKIVQQENTFFDRNGIDYYVGLLHADDFCRIHRSYLINLRHVIFLNKQDVQMVNGENISVSRLRRKHFNEVFQSYVKRTAKVDLW